MFLLCIEFLFGFAFGILIGTTVFLKTARWINRYIFLRGVTEQIILPSDETLPTPDRIQASETDSRRDQDVEEDEEDEDIFSVISRVRKAAKSDKPEKEGDRNTLVEDLKVLSNGLMSNIPTCSSENPEKDLVKLISDLPRISEEIRNNPTMQNMYSIVNNIGQGGSFSEEDFRKMQEGMTDMVSSLLGGDITSQEIEEQQSDSKIILDRLRKVERDGITCLTGE